MTTTVYQRTAVAGDSGTKVTVTASASTDIDLQDGRLRGRAAERA